MKLTNITDSWQTLFRVGSLRQREDLVAGFNVQIAWIV